jgi:hypothetical protein
MCTILTMPMTFISRHRARWIATFLVAGVGCSQPTPEDAAVAREGTQERAEAQADTIPDLIQGRVPTAVAGDSGWRYQQSVIADLDGDGADETIVLISDVSLDPGGAPLWEDGHRWQVYVRETDGSVTRLYARFLANGKLTAEIVTPASGTALALVLLEQTPTRMALYEFRYRGPNRVQVFQRFDRAIDAERRFTGSPRP